MLCRQVLIANFGGRHTREVVQGAGVKDNLKYKEVVPDDAVRYFGELAIEHHWQMLLHGALLIEQYGFCIEWIKGEAMLGAGWVGLWWNGLPGLKTEVYYAVQLYKLLHIGGRYKIFQ